MNRNVCARCAKPVYFAERKTSLGRDWHPSCLRCIECGRVLSPGQHAEHKGNPYCHTPCYKALFGPALLGYGSNIASPANFAKKDNAAEFGHDYNDDVYKREIYSNSKSSAAARRQRQRRSAPPSIVDHEFSAFSATTSAAPESVPDLRVTADNGVSSNHSERRNVTPSSSSQNSNSSLNSHSLAELALNDASDSKLNVSSVVNDKSDSKLTQLKPQVSSHSRSKSDQVVSVEERSGSFVVPSSIVSEDRRLNGEGSKSLVQRGSGSDVQSRNGSDPVLSGTHHAPDSTRFVSSSNVDIPPALRDVLQQVESFNSHYEGKVHHQMTVDQSPGKEVVVRGPLRIYWGLSRPIQLRQCDDIPALPISKWRHSLCANINEGPVHTTQAPAHKTHTPGGAALASPHRPMRGIDDSVLLSPSSAEDVVMRRQKVRKFNTVAYRSDAPTKWKRASINGHIFNYDTSVFTPVLGSSTSVMADSTMTSPVVIQTLMDKFKVENSPSQYMLSVVIEQGDQTQERVLGESDHPLLERLGLGPDDHNAKIFLKEAGVRSQEVVPLPIMEEEVEEEILPAEVEQLLILPVAVLKGLMIKYQKDEEEEVRRLRGKFERVKRKIRHRLEELKTA